MTSILLLLSIYWIIFFTLIGSLIYLLLNKRYNYWKDKNVDGPRPTYFLGNMTELFTIKHHMGAHFKYLYEKTKHLPFAGIFLLHRPALLINDVELIKHILAKDFIHFTDHGFFFDKKKQPLMNHLFNVNGAKWKAIRSKLSTAFTPSKIKQMFETVEVQGVNLTKYISSFAESGIEVDIQDAIAKFTMDVILSCAFGIENNSFEHPNSEFRTMGRKVFEVTTKKRINMFIALFIPEIHKITNGLILDKTITKFFINTVKSIVKYREDNNIVRNDLLQFLMKLKNDQIENIDDYIDNLPAKENETLDLQLTLMEMISQAFGFFVGGFETSSTSMGFLFYELAKCTEIQNKLIDEIDTVLEKHNGKMTYEALNDMTYMEQVIEEILRLYPPIPQHFRICTKEYIIPETNVTVEKGTPIVISTLGIQNDPKNYPNPEKFDPDRFSGDNKKNRSNFSFLSFGEGPRICIGMPLAMLQMRIAIVSILKYYKVEIGSKKDNTLEVVNKSLLMSPKDMMLKLSHRNK